MIRSKRTVDDAEGKFPGSTKVWMGLSLFLSFTLMVWSFSLPFRESMFTSQEEIAADQSDLQTTGIKYSERQVQEMRDAAVSLDDALMESVREKYAEVKKPGIQQTRRYWNQHVESVQQKVKQIGKAPEGSLESQYQRQLIHSLHDGPRD